MFSTINRVSYFNMCVELRCNQREFHVFCEPLEYEFSAGKGGEGGGSADGNGLLKTSKVRGLHSRNGWHTMVEQVEQGSSVSSGRPIGVLVFQLPQ